MLPAVEGRLLLKEGSLIDAEGALRTGVSVLVVEGRIERIDHDEALPVLPGDWAVPCRGRLIVPGERVCASLLPEPASSSVSRLDPSSLEKLCLYGLARAALSGVTAVAHAYAGEAWADRAGVRLPLRQLPVSEQPVANGDAGRVWAVVPGAVGDLRVLDAYPLGVLDAQGDPRWLGDSGRPAWVLVGGKVLVREGRLLSEDLLTLTRDAALLFGELFNF